MKGITVLEQYIGLQEVNDNAKIRSLLKSEDINGDIDIDPARVSWCAATINFTERSIGNTGTGKLTAQSFKTYGKELCCLEEAEKGDIVVFHFPQDANWQGHVAYYVSYNEEDDTVKVLGGNQRNSICYANYKAEYIVSITRP